MKKGRRTDRDTALYRCERLASLKLFNNGSHKAHTRMLTGSLKEARSPFLPPAGMLLRSLRMLYLRSFPLSIFLLGAAIVISLKHCFHLVCLADKHMCIHGVIGQRE